MADALESTPLAGKKAPLSLKGVLAILKFHRRILLAVSGGGDSVAMLHYFSTLDDRPELYVATVDHGLRPESASEAEFVARLCGELGLSHTTLAWNSTRGASSEDARLARYDLLARHALKIGATAIALGHTLDDQAETLVMRAQRMGDESSTRGLAGIPERAIFAVEPDQSVTLFRPMLGMKRADLRQYLTDRNQEWIDDPSNVNPDYERVRVRHAIQANNSLPKPESIARLASLASRGRRWLNDQTGRLLHDRLSIRSDGSLFLETAAAPAPILDNAFAILIAVAGGLEHRTPATKTRPLVEAFGGGSRLRRNIGRALVTVSPEGACFVREARNQATLGKHHGPVDGRFFVDDNGRVTPFIKALEQFRPQCDDPLYKAVMEKLGQRPNPTVETKPSKVRASA